MMRYRSVYDKQTRHLMVSFPQPETFGPPPRPPPRPIPWRFQAAGFSAEAARASVDNWIFECHMMQPLAVRSQPRHLIVALRSRASARAASRNGNLRFSKELAESLQLQGNARELSLACVLAAAMRSWSQHEQTSLSGFQVCQLLGAEAHFRHN